jgi:hypothetical protein
VLKVDDSKILQFEYRGAPQTIDVMRKAALVSQSRMVVRRLAEMVCERLDSKDYVSEYLAINNFLLQRTRYMRDPRTVELVRAPYVVAEEILAGGRPNLDCDDLAAMLGAMILAVGGSVRFVTVAFRNAFFNGKRQYSHVFAQALEPRTGLWIVLDPVAAEKTDDMMARVKAAAVWPVA